MTRTTRKRLIRFILFPVIFLLLLVVAAVLVLYSQRNKLVTLAVNELNKQLPGMLVVGGATISPFQAYPYLSIGLKDVQFYGNKQKAGKPIYESERLYVGFSLPDILQQKYHVKVIVLKNGHLDLVQDTAGRLNIVEASRLQQDTSAVADTGSVTLDLAVKKLIIKDMHVAYLDKQSGQRLSTQISKIQSAFKADSAVIQAKLTGAMLLDYTTPKDTVLFRHKHFETDLAFSYNKINRQIKLPTGKLKLEEARFNISGTADMLHGNNVDLRITGDKPDFKQLFSFAPEEVAKELKRFKYDGHLSFDGRIRGQISEHQLPLIELSFACENAWLHNTEANKKLDSLSFKGFYTNGARHTLQTSELRVMGMHARPDKGIFTGNFVMRDFTDPKILMQMNSELELSFISAFLGIKELERITGHVSLQMNFKELVDISAPEQSMGKLTQGIQSELKVSDLTFRIPDFPHTIRNLNLHADMKNGFVRLDSLAFLLGNSDFHLSGSLSDLPALFHHQQKPVEVTFNARSNRMIMKELLAFDTARSSKAKEEIHHFNIGVALETSVQELLQPRPLPKGKFKIQKLFASFKHYPHAFHDFGAQLIVNDTALMLRNFGGMIDSTDLLFSGRVVNYQLWFDKVKRGRTQIAFDLKSKRLAMRDLLGPLSSKLVPPDYHNEITSNLWLRSKTDLRYDSTFRFAKVKIANISANMQQHAFHIDSIKGTVMFGADHFVRIDTLTGKVGRSDFDISMRLYTGKDTIKRKKENYLRFASKFLDVDQLTNYRFTTTDTSAPAFSTAPPRATAVANKTTSAHAGAFNIFQVPFIDFTGTVNVGRIKYHRLWIKNLYSNARMRADQHLFLDTLSLEIAEGRLRARGYFNGADPKHIFMKSRIRIDDMNIEKMMLKLDYLGQDYVINKNIKGRLNGVIKSYVQIHPDLTPLIDKSEAELDVDIHNGELINFTPIQAMSKYFKDKNLNMVRFDTLRNKLSFKNGALIIPSMNINSSLGFMEISGRQALDMQMEYYMRIPMKMVTSVGFRALFGRKQEEIDPTQVDEIEIRDMNKKIMFMNLKVTGTPDDYKIGLGKAKKS